MSSAKCSALKAYIQVASITLLNRVYLGIYTYTHTHSHTITVNEKRAINLKESGEKHIEGLGGKKGRGEML